MPPKSLASALKEIGIQNIVVNEEPLLFSPDLLTGFNLEFVGLFNLAQEVAGETQDNEDLPLKYVATGVYESIPIAVTVIPSNLPFPNTQVLMVGYYGPDADPDFYSPFICSYATVASINSLTYHMRAFPYIPSMDDLNLDLVVEPTHFPLSVCCLAPMIDELPLGPLDQEIVEWIQVRKEKNQQLNTQIPSKGQIKLLPQILNIAYMLQNVKSGYES